jgi:4-amino-4-deoxy-L-arabinose transferase-like glycosyltransferase
MPHAARVALVIFAACGVYLVGIGRVQLFDRDEPRNAQAARQMLQSGDWVVPRLLDKVRTAKPPLTYWCQATAMKLIGDNEGGCRDTAAARLPSVMAMTLTLIVLAVVLTKCVDANRAFWTVLILATSGIIIGFSGKASMHDAILLLWVTIAQLCLYAMLGGRGSWPVVIAMAVAIGCGGLTKGPVILGVLATTLVVLAFLTWLGRPARAFLFEETRARRPSQVVVKTFVAIVIVVAIVTPWVWLVEHRSPGFLFTSVSHDVIRRTFEPLEQHKGPPGYYLLTVWATFFPWSVLLPLSLVVAWRHRAEPRTRFALAAAVGPWLMFEVVQTKLPHYLLPTFPALAFLLADAVVRCLAAEHEDLTTRGTRAAVTVWGVIVLGLGIAPWFLRVPRDRALTIASVTFTICAVAYAAAVVIPFLRRRPPVGLINMALGVMAAIPIAWGLYLPNAEFLRLGTNVASILKQNARGTQPGDVQMIGYKEPSLAFHQGGTIREQPEDNFLAAHPPNDWPRFIVITEPIWQQTPDPVKQQFDILGTARGINPAKGKSLTVLVLRKRLAADN